MSNLKDYRVLKANGPWSGGERVQLSDADYENIERKLKSEGNQNGIQDYLRKD